MPPSKRRTFRLGTIALVPLLLLTVSSAAAASGPPGPAPAVPHVPVAAPAPPPAAGAPPPAPLLFTLSSSDASLDVDPASGEGVLTLRGVAESAVWLAERPARAAGALATSDLASDRLCDEEGVWLSRPNAALTGTAGGETVRAWRVGVGAAVGGRGAGELARAPPLPTLPPTPLPVPPEPLPQVTVVLTITATPRHDAAARTLAAPVALVRNGAAPPWGAGAGEKMSGGSPWMALVTPSGGAGATVAASPALRPAAGARLTATLASASLFIDQYYWNGYLGSSTGCLTSMGVGCSGMWGYAQPYAPSDSGTPVFAPAPPAGVSWAVARHGHHHQE